MNRMQATLKIPQSEIEAISHQLHTLGVEEIETRIVPYDKFVRESRMNYDCVFQDMWTDQKEVAYLNLFFDDSEKGRLAAYHVEFYLKQIPLNLRYVKIPS